MTNQQFVRAIKNLDLNLHEIGYFMCVSINTVKEWKLGRRIPRGYIERSLSIRILKVAEKLKRMGGRLDDIIWQDQH